MLDVCPICNCPRNAPLTVKRVAAAWNVSYSTVLRLCRSGEIDAVKLGGVWRIPHVAVDDYIAEHSSRPGDAA